jgi:long-subunit acyl-CoA synthetase (AMP-forming)
MKGYYNKPELTEKSTKDDWITTGDLAEIDDEGFVYIWGRLSDKVKSADNKEVYLFDVANLLRENKFIDDAIVLQMPTDENENNLVAHIVWNEEVAEANKKDCIKEMNRQLESFLPEGIEVSAYSAHKGMLPYSPTTLKKDKNGLSRQYSGYVQVIDDKMCSVEFAPNDIKQFSKKTKVIEKGKSLIKRL